MQRKEEAISHGDLDDVAAYMLREPFVIQHIRLDTQFCLCEAEMQDVCESRKLVMKICRKGRG